jgi:hypothetical protein
MTTNFDIEVQDLMTFSAGTLGEDDFETFVNLLRQVSNNIPTLAKDTVNFTMTAAQANEFKNELDLYIDEAICMYGPTGEV